MLEEEIKNNFLDDDKEKKQNLDAFSTPNKKNIVNNKFIYFYTICALLIFISNLIMRYK